MDDDIRQVPTAGHTTQMRLVCMIHTHRRWNDWHACLAGDPTRWGCGRTEAEAIGSCIITHGDDIADAIRRDNPWSETVPCPYCSYAIERTVKPHEIDLCGEHCPECHLPFGIDERGNPYGQDDPRWT